jgi:hypothetical protein
MAGHLIVASYQAFFTKKGSLPADKGSGQGAITHPNALFY